jgi:uncharacterized protein YgbK (DUF1537 family)
MVKLAVIADDLTGAADTAVQFCPYFMNPILVSYKNLSPDASKTAPFDTEVLAVYTNSRSMTPELAGKRVGQIARVLTAYQPLRTYKKIDSCLRGNVGTEVDAIIDEMGYALSFVAPAFPAMGRTTLHDMHLVDGIPVSQTELSKDPITPVTESLLSRVVADKSRYPVYHVDIRFLDKSDEALFEQIKCLAERGARHLVFDATEQNHLDKIAHTALVSPERVLLVGSAGLAESLGRHFSRKQSLHMRSTKTTLKGNHLLVCGTASERTSLQISMLTKIYPYEVISLHPRLLGESTNRNSLRAKVPWVCSALTRQNLIVRIASPEMGMGGVDPKTSERMIEGLAFFIASVLKKTKPANLFLTGGDTANAVLEAIGVEAIRLSGEIVTGVAKGMLIGGLADGVPAVTKAGAFGDKDTLIALHEHWEEERQGASK